MPVVAIAEANFAVLWEDPLASYRVLVGIDYPPDKRAEIGDVVDDLPGKSIKWLVECGAIEKVDGKPAKNETMVEETVVEVPEVTDEPAVVEADTDGESEETD